MVRKISGFIIAVLSAYVLGAIAATQAVLQELARMGAEVDFSTRLETTFHDLIGMSGSYLPLIAVAFIVAWPIATVIVRRIPDLRTFGYAAAGAVAIVAMHLIMKQVLDVTGIAAARTVPGLIAQGIAGAFGGWCYARLSRPQSHQFVD